jgi:hypothetical protein
MPTRIYTNRIDGEQRIHVEINAAEICDILDDFTPSPDAFASTKEFHRLLMESLAVFSPALAESHKATALPATACGGECAEGHAYAGRCALYDPTACVWPDCLTDGQQAELAEQVRATEFGEPTTPMPDQRQVCGCRDKPTSTCPAATWAGLTICVTCPTPEPGTACAREPGALLRAATARTAPDNPAASNNETDNGLRERYAAAMREHYLITNRDEADADGNMPCRCGDWREGGDADEYDWDHHLAEAVLAVRDRRMKQLAAEVERLGDWCRTVSARALDAEGDRDRWHDELADNETDRVAAVRRAETAEATLAAVRVVADKFADLDQLGAVLGFSKAADCIRTALDGPADTTPPAVP